MDLVVSIHNFTLKITCLVEGVQSRKMIRISTPLSTKRFLNDPVLSSQITFDFLKDKKEVKQ